MLLSSVVVTFGEGRRDHCGSCHMRKYIEFDPSLRCVSLEQFKTLRSMEWLISTSAPNGLQEKNASGSRTKGAFSRYSLMAFAHSKLIAIVFILLPLILRLRIGTSAPYPKSLTRNLVVSGASIVAQSGPGRRRARKRRSGSLKSRGPSAPARQFYSSTPYDTAPLSCGIPQPYCPWLTG